MAASEAVPSCLQAQGHSAWLPVPLELLAMYKLLGTVFETAAETHLFSCFKNLGGKKKPSFIFTEANPSGQEVHNQNDFTLFMAFIFQAFYVWKISSKES